MKRWQARFRGLNGTRCTYLSATFPADAGAERIRQEQDFAREDIAWRHNPNIAAGASWQLIDWDLEPVDDASQSGKVGP
jgi:hypothetical protein